MLDAIIRGLLAHKERQHCTSIAHQAVVVVAETGAGGDGGSAACTPRQRRVRAHPAVTTQQGLFKSTTAVRGLRHTLKK